MLGFGVGVGLICSRECGFQRSQRPGQHLPFPRLLVLLRVVSKEERQPQVPHRELLQGQVGPLEEHESSGKEKVVDGHEAAISLKKGLHFLVFEQIEEGVHFKLLHNHKFRAFAHQLKLLCRQETSLWPKSPPTRCHLRNWISEIGSQLTNHRLVLSSTMVHISRK